MEGESQSSKLPLYQGICYVANVTEPGPDLPQREQKQDFLTTDIRVNAVSLRKSNSQQSFDSGTTEVCANPDYVLVEKDINCTTLTSDIEVRVGRWEAFKIFLFGSKYRTVPVAVEVTNIPKDHGVKVKVRPQ